MTEQLDDKVRGLVHSRWGRRRLRAVEQLREIADARSIPVLAGMLRDSRIRVGDAAADALRDDFGTAGRAAMRAVCEQGDDWARLAVERSLAVERHPQLKRLDEALKDPDVDEWGPTLEYLVSIGAEARPLIERELMDRKGPPMMREMCASAFAELVGENARPLLKQVARTTRSSTVKSAAHRALHQLDRARMQERAEM